MLRGDGSMFLATRKGVRVLGLGLLAASTPAPTSWPHDSACAWTAAWMTVRDRNFLGQRELLSSTDWSGQLRWTERYNHKRRGHRPDLIGYVGQEAIAFEVELAGKSRARLDAILRLHRDWITTAKSGAVFYVCGDEDSRRRVERAGQRIGFGEGYFRIELLNTIKQQTIAVFESQKADAAGGSVSPAPMLPVHDATTLRQGSAKGGAVVHTADPESRNGSRTAT